jgi:hypothetical protein
MHRRRRSWLPLVIGLLAAVVILPTVASSADAATSRWTAKCAANIRAKPWKSAVVLKVIKAGAVVTATNSVEGGYWKADCKGDVAGRMWLKIIAINGKTTKSLFGRSAVYAAKGLFKYGPTSSPSTTVPRDWLANCAVRLRASASTSATTRAIIDQDSVVTSIGTVTGSSWAADCGSSVSGTTWFKVTAGAASRRCTG